MSPVPVTRQLARHPAWRGLWEVGSAEDLSAVDEARMDRATRTRRSLRKTRRGDDVVLWMEGKP